MYLSTRINQTLAIKLAAAATTYGFTIFMSRALGLEAFGAVAFFLNLALFLSVVGARGQQIGALRYVPGLVERRETAALGAFSRRALLRTLVGTLVLTGFAGGVLALVGQQYPLALALPGLLLIPLVGWIDVQTHIARGGQLIGLALMPKEVAWRLIAGLVAAAIFWATGGHLGAGTVLWVLVVVLCAVTVVQGRALRRLIPVFNRKCQSAAAANPVWRESEGAFWVTSVSNIFLANADVLLVGLIGGAGAAALYFVANRVAMLLSFFQTSTNMALAPMLAQAWSGGAPRTCDTLLRQAAIRMTLPTVIAGMGLLAFAPQVLSVFGPHYQAAATPLRLLVLAGMANAAAGCADIALNMCGFHRQAMRTSAKTLVISAALLLAGALWAGAVGVAAAVLASTLIRKALFWHQARCLLRTRTDVFARPGHAAARPIAAAP